MAARRGPLSFGLAAPPSHKGSDPMLSWLSANLVNIALIAAIVLIVAWLIRVMIRDRRAGKAPCGGNCASCGACHGCASCSQCGTAKGAIGTEQTSGVSGDPS